MSESFISCPCNNCGKFIEFDRTQLGLAQTRTVTCPHCQQETIIFDKEARRASLQNAAEPRILPSKPGTVFLSLGCILMFLVGAVFIISAFVGEASEQNPQAGAVRQVTYTLEYGFGCLMLILSMILAALIRLIRGEIANPN